MQVLCFGSDYFRALLKPGWAEERGSTLRVDGAHSACTFKAILSWIYIKATPPLEAGVLPALMSAASFYLLPDLHAECLRMASAALSMHNVFSWLVFAEEHQEKDLRSAALQYAGAHYYRMRRQLPEISDQMLQSLATRYPALLVQLMDAIRPSPGMAAASRKRAREGDGS